MHYKKIFDEAFNAVQKENDNLKIVNLLVTGKSGVGKSTLINAVFGEELAKTGVGKPVTDKIELIEQVGFPVRIYDTIGFELEKFKFNVGSLVKSITKNDIQKLIKKLQNTETSDDDIHVIWYLISGTSSRIEEAEIDFINWLVEQKLPVIIGLTKSYDLQEAELLKSEILKLVPSVTQVVPLLALPTEYMAAFGIEAIIQSTFTSLPEGLQASFVHSQEASLLLKKEEAKKIVALNMAAMFGASFSEDVNYNSPQIKKIQSQMMIKITSLYGIDVDPQKIETALTSMNNVSKKIITGQNIAKNIANLFPIVGNISSGIISGSVGMALIGTLGYAYIGLMELVLKGSVNLSSTTPEELTNLIIENLPNILPKQNKKKIKTT